MKVVEGGDGEEWEEDMEEEEEMEYRGRVRCMRVGEGYV